MASQNGATVHAFMKPEVVQNSLAQGKLKPFQDEKRDIYQKHMDIAADVFERARQVRAQMTTQYEARTKLIHDRLNDINKRNDAATQELNNTLKAFSNTFDEGLASRKEAWKAELKVGTQNLWKNVAANTEEETRLDGLIKAEHEACKEHTQKGIGPILEKLQEHRESLAKSIAERESKHKEFVDGLALGVQKLKKTLSEESRVRNQECTDSHARTKVAYAELKEKQRQQTEATRLRLQDFKNLVDLEERDTKNSNTWVTHEMMQFMEHFELNVRGAMEKQELAKAHLKNLKDVFNQ